MVSSILINETIEQFRFLKYAPNTPEAIKGYIKLINVVIKTDQEFKIAFNLWAEKNDEFPSHIQLKEILEPAIPKYSVYDVFTNPDVSKDILNIRRWCNENFNCEMPRPTSWEFRTMTETELKTFEKSQVMALQAFYKRVRMREIDFKQVTTGEHFKRLDSGPDNSGIDVSKIGRVE